MIKSVLISINPQYCGMIANGKKTIEVRKSRPKLETPFKVYIYCTKSNKYFFHGGKPYIKDNVLNGKVIGEFVCDDIIGGFLISPWSDFLQKQTCLTYEEINAYGKNKLMYYWHISDLKIYDEPKEISDFRKPCIMPESPYCPWCDKGYEYISESEAEFYRIDGECSTEWVCLNYITRPPQSWCYLDE